MEGVLRICLFETTTPLAYAFLYIEGTAHKRLAGQGPDRQAAEYLPLYPKLLPFLPLNQKRDVHKISGRNSGAGNGRADFMGAWHFLVLSAGKPPMPIQILLLGGGGGCWVFFEGEVEVPIFYGREDFFLEKPLQDTFREPFLEPSRKQSREPFLEGPRCAP